MVKPVPVISDMVMRRSSGGVASTNTVPANTGSLTFPAASRAAARIS